MTLFEKLTGGIQPSLLDLIPAGIEVDSELEQRSSITVDYTRHTFDIMVPDSSGLSLSKGIVKGVLKSISGSFVVYNNGKVVVLFPDNANSPRVHTLISTYRVEKLIITDKSTTIVTDKKTFVV